MFVQNLPLRLNHNNGFYYGTNCEAVNPVEFQNLPFHFSLPQSNENLKFNLENSMKLIPSNLFSSKSVFQNQHYSNGKEAFQVEEDTFTQSWKKQQELSPSYSASSSSNINNYSPTSFQYNNNWIIPTKNNSTIVSSNNSTSSMNNSTASPVPMMNSSMKSNFCNSRNNSFNSNYLNSNQFQQQNQWNQNYQPQWKMENNLQSSSRSGSTSPMTSPNRKQTVSPPPVKLMSPWDENQPKKLKKVPEEEDPFEGFLNTLADVASTEEKALKIPNCDSNDIHDDKRILLSDLESNSSEDSFPSSPTNSSPNSPFSNSSSLLSSSSSSSSSPVLSPSSSSSSSNENESTVPLMKKKEGLEEAADRMLHLLQEKGHMNFKQIHKDLGLDYRRAYDILNVLTTTPLISKRGKKRDHEQAYLFLDGKINSSAIDVKSIGDNLEKEKQRKNSLMNEIECLKKKLTLAEAVLCEEIKN